MNEKNEKEDVRIKEEKQSNQKGKNKKGLIIGIIIVIILVLFGVGGYFAYTQGLFYKLESVIGIVPKIPIGKYDLIEMVDGEETYSKEQLNALKSFGLEITLEIKDGSTGALNMYGEPEEFTYDSKNINVEGESTPYKLEKNQLIFEQDGYKLVFEKVEN